PTGIGLIHSKPATSQRRPAQRPVPPGKHRRHQRQLDARPPRLLNRLVHIKSRPGTPGETRPNHPDPGQLVRIARPRPAIVTGRADRDHPIPRQQLIHRSPLPQHLGDTLVCQRPPAHAVDQPIERLGRTAMRRPHRDQRHTITTRRTSQPATHQPAATLTQPTPPPTPPQMTAARQATTPPPPRPHPPHPPLNLGPKPGRGLSDTGPEVIRKPAPARPETRSPPRHRHIHPDRPTSRPLEGVPDLP